MITSFDTSAIPGAKSGKSIIPTILVLGALAYGVYYFYTKSQEAKKEEANEND